MKLPPLNALRAFEVAARLGSFSSAGHELGVSAAAVSLQVRNLEGFLGRTVFERRANQIRLTDAGRDLYQNAAAQLADISRYTEGLINQQNSTPLVISALPSLAYSWLGARLGVLSKRGELGRIRLRVEDDPVDWEEQGVDIRLTYGASGFDDFECVPLFRDEVVPMAAPALRAVWDAGDIASLPLIDMDWGRRFARTPRWANWFAAHRADHSPPDPALIVPGGSAALEMAAAGVGVCLGQRRLAEGMLYRGQLVEVSSEALSCPDEYVLIVAHHRLRQARIRALVTALSGAASG